MGSVHLAHDIELDRRVAVKVLAEHLSDEPEVRERFVREARLAARLAHPNVVTVFDAGVDEGIPYIVMEYVDGETLAETLRSAGHLPPEHAVDLALQACGGLEHAHAAGIVHRDIKPQNLLVRSDGTLKIADFGIARAAEATAVTQLGTVLGTAAYAAPEQLAGEQVTGAADIYALGAVLYELLTGKTPYVFESLADLARKQDDEPIVPPSDRVSDVPPALEAVVMRALARDPEYRPASAAELAEALAAASPEPPTQPLPARTGVRSSEVTTLPVLAATDTVDAPPHPVRTRRPILPLAVVGLLVLAVAVAFLAGRDGGGDAPPRPRPVEPIPRGADAQEQAENLSRWLREHSR